MPSVVDVHLAGGASRVDHILSQEVLFELIRPRSLLVVLEYLDSLFDVLLEVLTEEHQHVDWTLHLFSDVNHEQELLVVLCLNQRNLNMLILHVVLTLFLVLCNLLYFFLLG